MAWQALLYQSGLEHTAGTGGSFGRAMGAQQRKQTSTSVVTRSQVSGESFPLAESHLLLYFISFRVFCKFNKYIRMQRQGSRESLHEWWAASYTTCHQQPWLGACSLFCAGGMVSNCCEALGCNMSRTFVSEQPGWVQGAGRCRLAGVACSMFKKIVPTLHLSRKSFFAYSFFLLNPLRISLDYSCTARPS